MKSIVLDMYGVIVKQTGDDFVPYVRRTFPDLSVEEIHTPWFKADIGEITSLEQLKEFSEQLTDIFGKMPRETVNLLEIAKLRIILSRSDCRKLTVADNTVTIHLPGGAVYRKNGKIPRLDPRDTPQMRLRQLQLLAEMVAKETTKTEK